MEQKISKEELDEWMDSKLDRTEYRMKKNEKK